MVSFDINDKVAIITGGASGIGFQYAIELLKKGARGITLADIDSVVGGKALLEIEIKFGKNKAIFVKADVTNLDELDEAFKQTLSAFNNVDILINNAGIMNDEIWQREININMNGSIHGILLALETYIPKYKSGPEGLILNISSIVGVAPTGALPIYTGTKFAIHGMTLAWGLPSHFERTKIRVVGVCPGITLTPLIADMACRNLGPAYEKIRVTEIGDPGDVLVQSTNQVATHVMKIIEKASSGTMWIVEGGEEPYQYQMPNRLTMPRNGTIHGILLGMDNYIPKYKSGPEGLIVNISSIAGISALGSIPVYVGTKFAIHGITTEEIAPSVMKVIERAPSGTMWVIEEGQAPYQYQMPDRLTMTKVLLP